MIRILLLFTPVVLFVLTLTGVINLHTLKSNVKALPAKTIKICREISDKTADELSRRFPNLLKRRD